MQTAVFYPLHLILALIPSGKNYPLSPPVYHAWFVFAHFLGAAFMYALLRHFELGRFAAYLGGICFSLGGFVARMPWPHMLESSIWLPLILLFFLRAVESERTGQLVLSASSGGIALGLSILAGGLHVWIMQALAILAAAIFLILNADDYEPDRNTRHSRVVLAALIIGFTGLAAGAIQLAASAEYSYRALRWLGTPGALQAHQKIPYDLLQDGTFPGAFITLLVPMASFGGGEIVNPYIGVLPMVFAIVGIRTGWHQWLIRFLTLLAVLAFLYSLGSYSLVHGLLYEVIPRLWLAREAGRLVYLADFPLAVLAAFGTHYLFTESIQTIHWRGLHRFYTWGVIAIGTILLTIAIVGRPDINPWIQFSLLMIFLSYVLFSSIIRGNVGRLVKFLTISLIIFDLAAFDWSAANKRLVARNGTDYFERLFSCKRAVEFLKAQPGTFRVEVAADPPPNIGDFFGIETIFGAGVTIPTDYFYILGRRDLLNVRYRLSPASTNEPGAIWSDGTWQVHEVPNHSPRAWLAHNVVAPSSGGDWRTVLSNPAFDPRQTAIVDAPLSLEPAGSGGHETVLFTRLDSTHIRVQTHAASQALLVLSETYYPGWRASVNGSPARIYKTDGALRGIVVPKGDSEVSLRYLPFSIIAGGAISIIAFAGVLAAWIITGVKRLRTGSTAILGCVVR